eukprot:1312823-Amphidinium_carterae.1
MQDGSTVKSGKRTRLDPMQIPTHSSTAPNTCKGETRTSQSKKQIIRQCSRARLDVGAAGTGVYTSSILRVRSAWPTTGTHRSCLAKEYCNNTVQVKST